MADDLHTTPEPSLTSLVAGIVNDGQTLIKQEIALARREIREEVHKVIQAALSLSIGAGLLVMGAFFLILAVPLLLAWAVPAIPLWGWFAIVGAVLAISGGALLFLARARAEEIHIVPPQTATTMKENAQWIRNQT